MNGNSASLRSRQPIILGRIIDWVTGQHWYKAVTDVSAMLVQQVASTGISAITSMLTARGLGPSGIGLVGLAQTVTGMTTLLSSLGLDQTAVRYTSREFAAGRPDLAMAVLRWALRQRLAIVLLVSLIAFGLAPFLANNLWHKPELTTLIRIALPLSVIAALAFVPDVYFQSTRQFHINAMVRIGESTVSLLGILSLWLFSLWTPSAVVIISTLATGVGALLFLSMVPRAAIFARADLPLFRIRELRSILQYPHEGWSQDGELSVEKPGTFARHMFFSSLLAIIITRLDFILLGIYRPASEVGMYSIGTQLAMPLAFLTGALSATLFPRVSAARSGGALRSLAKQTVKISVVAFLAAVVYSLVVPGLAPIILGERFRGSVQLGHLLCFRGCLAVLICPLSIIGYALGLAQSYVFLNVVKLVVVAGINILFLPRYGAVVPAFALIANEAVNVLGVAFLVLISKSRFQSTVSPKPVASS